MTTTPEIIDFPGFPTVVVRGRGIALDGLSTFMDDAFGALVGAIEQGAFIPAGPAFCRYDTVVAADETGQIPPLDLEAGFPVDVPLPAALTQLTGQGEGQPGVRIEPSELPACRLAVTKHHGSYDGLGEAWQQFMDAILAAGFTPGMPYWEAYDTEPTPEMDPDELITGLAVPVTRE